MMPSGSQLRPLLQEFVEARIDAPELFARAGELLPAGSDPAETILELLAEAELRLRLPSSRKAVVRRLEQFAQGETSYPELGLWCFSLGQTEPLSDPLAEPTDPEAALLQSVADWVDEWEEESARPGPETVREVARLLERERDPATARARLEEARDRFQSD